MDKIKIVADFASDLNVLYICFHMFHCMVVLFLLIFVTLHKVCFFDPVLSENLGTGQKQWRTVYPEVKCAPPP